jgi:hypothetical protein
MGHQPIHLRLTPVARIEKPGLLEYGAVSLVYDNEFAYLGVPRGLMKARVAKGTTKFETIAFEHQKIQSVYSYGRDLYVLKDTAQDGDHTFLVSRDQGRTFSSLDEGLRYSAGGKQGFLVPTEMNKVADKIYLNAGGGMNTQVSSDNGRTWKALTGELVPQKCYHNSFDVRGKTFILGGECPLNVAWIRRGVLDEQLTSFSESPQMDAIAGMSNRNVQFIRSSRNHETRRNLFAGVEGGLLKSSDDGRSWRWVIRYPGDGKRYPYIQSIVFHKGTDNITVSGFDKDTKRAYVAHSVDSGETFTDLSRYIGGEYVNAPVLVSTPSGRTILGLYDKKRNALEMFDVRFTSQSTTW